MQCNEFHTELELFFVVDIFVQLAQTTNILTYKFFSKTFIIIYFQGWDDELASTAQRLADQCKYQHDCLDCRKVCK